MFWNRTKKQLSRNSIKEAFDNLPSGICYFNKRGLPLLVNHTMDRLAFQLMGHDLQTQWELTSAISELEDGIFHSEDGKIWKFQLKKNTKVGMECLVEDVTALFKENELLLEKNRELKEMTAFIQEASRNMVAIAREEEILAMKMQIHKEMGKSVLNLQKYIKRDCSKEEKEELISQLKSSVALLKGEVGQNDETDPIEELLHTAEAIGAKISFTGQPPKEKQAELLMLSAMQECLTNAIRHGKGNTLYVNVKTGRDNYTIHFTNNGTPPEEPVVEGGGLSSLRKKLQKHGATMKIQSFPEFCLTVNIPRKGESS